MLLWPLDAVMVLPKLLFLADVDIFGFVAGDEDVVMILLHIVVPNIDVVHNVFSDSALGDDTST